VSASGGTPTSLLGVNRGDEDLVSVRWPRFLADARRSLYTVSSNQRGLSGIYLGSLDRQGEKIRLSEGSGAGEGLSAAAYAPPRKKHPWYLLWVRANTLMARPLDPDRAQFSGEAAPVAGAGLGYASYQSFSVSNEGIILLSSEANRYQLTWFSRVGNVLSTVGQPERYAALRIAPDGGRTAIVLVDSSGNRDIWQMDLARGVQTRITTNGRGFVAVWSPDGQRLAYHTAYAPYLFERFASGAGQEEMVLQSKYPVYINDWSPDGRYLMYTETSPESQNDLWLLPTSGDRKPISFLKSPFNESHGQFSHGFARWRRDHRELFPSCGGWEAHGNIGPKYFTRTGICDPRHLCSGSRSRSAALPIPMTSRLTGSKSCRLRRWEVPLMRLP